METESKSKYVENKVLIGWKSSYHMLFDCAQEIRRFFFIKFYFSTMILIGTNVAVYFNYTNIKN